MNRVLSFTDKLIDRTFFFVNLVQLFKYLLEYPKFHSYLKRNLELQDAYQGLRCYILGNGPSLNNVDINSLKKEYTFVTNHFFKTSLYDQLEPSFYCAGDKSMFEGDILRELTKLIDENKYGTKFLFVHKSMTKFKINRIEDVYYVYRTYLPTSNGITCSLHKNACNFLNIVPFAIMCAIYMGFQEIILLGCDFNQYVYGRNYHFFKDSISVKKTSLYEDLLEHAIICSQHYYLKKYADDHGISILNASDGTLLDAYPQVNLVNYLNSNRH
jgi:uncharacterized Rossmann fold enzyme